jgi:hypothetical protein
MNRLRKLADPLLQNPPRSAPSMDDLHARVRRRREVRRRRQIAVTSAFVILLLVGTALAFRQDQGLETLTGPPGTTTGTGLPGTTIGSMPATTLPLPPPVVQTDVELVVDPASSDASKARKVVVRNDSTADYLTCWGWDVHRWSGAEWVDVGSVWAAPNDGTLTRYRGRLPVDCSPTVIPAHTAQAHVFDVSHASFFPVNAGETETTPAPFPPGLYELSDASTRGRFEITASTPTGTQPEHGVQVGKNTVGLNPGTTLQKIHEVLPADVRAIDDDTIALAWTASCNSPADHVEVVATATEIELRLSVGIFIVEDCMGEPDHWVVTFDVPVKIAGRPIVARASTDKGAEETEHFEAAPAGSRDEPWSRPEIDAAGLSPTSMLLRRDTKGTVQLRLSPAGCWRGGTPEFFHLADGTVVPQWFDRSDPTTSCGDVQVGVGDGTAKVFGAPPAT